MTQISRLRNAEIANGNLINADDIATELNQLVTESNNQDTRLTTAESGTTTISGNKTWSGNSTFSGTASLTNAVTLSGTITLSGQTNLARTTDPSSLNNGDFWYNATSNLFKAQINGNTVQIASLTDLGAYPTGYHGSAAPSYTSATTFTLASIHERDSSDTANIIKNSSTTVDITTIGLNGMAQSANLTGTISITATGTTVTGTSTTFTSSFKVGDVLTTAGSQSRVITLISSNTAMTVAPAWTSTETTVSYKRGGRATNTFYHAYPIVQAAGANPGLLLSTRNVAAGDTLVDLPSGYTLNCQMPFNICLDSSANIVPFRIGAGWPSRPHIQFIAMESTANYYRLISSFAVASWTTFNAGSIIPPNTRLMDILVSYAGGGGAQTDFAVRETGSGLSTGRSVSVQAGTTFFASNAVSNVPVNATQQIDFKGSGTGTPISVWVTGYTITEVQ